MAATEPRSAEDVLNALAQGPTSPHVEAPWPSPTDLEGLLERAGITGVDPERLPLLLGYLLSPSSRGGTGEPPLYEASVWSRSYGGGIYYNRL